MTKARVLIVEDERLVARELRLRLEGHGYQITGSVATADDAMRAAAAETPDLVLMDIHIQGERDGIEAARLLQERFDVPVVFLTANGDDQTVERAKAVGAAGYLIKPPNDRTLVVAIEVARHKHELARQLRTRERWFSTTLRSIGDAVISTDAVGNVAFMNPVAESLTGWRAEDAHGQPAAAIVKIIRDQGGPEGPLAESFRRRQTIHVDGLLTDRQGRQRAISDSAAPIVDESGSLLGSVLVFRDVTEQSAMERQLEAAERLSSLGTLAAGVAHEMNNPLTWMMVNLEELVDALGRGSPSPEDLTSLRERAMESLQGAERIRRIVRDLAVFSRRAPERSGCDVVDAVRQAVASTPTRVPVDVEIPASARVAMDESRLVQVLANLLTNAVHAIEAAPSRAHRITLRVTPGNGAVRITVTDTGTGIADDVRARVFEPFFTTKPQGEGTGLGLSISHGLVFAAGGTIEVESTPGHGTTFTLRLPAAKDREGDAAPVVAPTRRARVLVVDDEATLRRVIGRTLREHDVQTVVAAEALDLLRAGQRYDVVLCDLMMAEVTGMDLYEAILALDPAQAERVVFMTGGAFNIRSAEFLASAKNQVLEKPFSPLTLQNLVRERVART